MPLNPNKLRLRLDVVSTPTKSWRIVWSPTVSQQISIPFGKLKLVTVILQKKTSTHTLGQYSITIGGRVIFAKD